MPKVETKKLASGNNTSRLGHWLPWILIVGGLIGLICFTILSHDELAIAKNPNFQPSCNLNPVIACGSVMKSWQARVFGIPNPFIGLGAFPVAITVGAALLAGAKFRRWFWLGLELGTFLGLAFAYWLLFESIYSIKALCPYCLASDVVVTAIFWYVTQYNLENKHLRLPKTFDKTVAFSRRHHLDILVLWFIIVIAVILQHFWYYYGHYF